MSVRRRRAPIGVRGGLTILLVLLLLLALLVGMQPAGSPQGGPSVRSTERTGRRGLFLLLASDLLGLRPVAWHGAPGDLPSGRSLLILPDVPGRSEPPDERRSAPAVPSRLRDPRHYRRFLDSGGILLAPGTDAVLRFLDEEVGVADLDELEVRTSRTVARREAPAVTLPSGEVVQPELRGWSWFEGPDGGALPKRAAPIARDGEARDFALRLPVGRGAVVLVADDELWDNRHLEDGDNALLFVRIVEALEPLERVLFDEYALGGWSPRSPLQLALTGRFRPLTLHLAALAALLVWCAAGRRVFPRDPAPTVVRSALARAEGFAGLLLGRRRPDLAAQLLRAASLRRLARRVGLRPVALDPHGPGGGLLEPVLSALGPEAERAGLVDRARMLLGESRVEGDAALAALAHGLDDLEARLHALAHAAGESAPPAPDRSGRGSRV